MEEGTLRCEECGATLDVVAHGWRAFIAPSFEDEERAPEVVVYCPECAEREFGE